MLVTKRNGVKQELDLNKIHAVITWACEGMNDDNLSPIKGVSVSEIEMKAQLQLYEGMPTKMIHEAIIKAAADCISEDTPNYDQVAARLVWFSVRKEAFGKNIPPSLLEVVKNNIDKGIYTPEIMSYYTEEEINYLDSIVDHSRDDLFKYAGAEQMRKKYLVQNRKTKKVFESFQFPYILTAALLFARYPKNTRIKFVKRYYDLISQHYISLPTPIMAGMRTKKKQFSSCVLLESGDTLKSINAAASAIVDYASMMAGIGLSIGSIRAEGQAIRNGDAVSTGVIPFAKYFNGALKSCSQGAVRGASATFNYPIWHLEFEKLIELKNNKGTEETRLRTVDYSVHINKVFYERLIKKGNITFFSPEEVPDLYKAFYSSNVKEFEKLYKQYEKDATKTKKVLPAVDVFTKIMNERFETGRIYILNADTVNQHGTFYESIKMSNLCHEITLPTTPITYPGDKSYNHEESLIALCTLSAINWGKFTPFGDLDIETSTHQRQENKLKDVCEMAVRGLDALLDYQDYPVEAARRHSMRYRPLGIGIIGFAHWLAKGKLYWGEEKTLAEVETMMEKMAYYLTDTSINLAKEFGSIPVKTKYHDGEFPHQRSSWKGNSQMDWIYLGEKAKKYGIRNATLMAMMPSETSSQLANETNGIEPPKELLTVKGSKDGVLPQIVPDYFRCGAYYQTQWNVSVPDYLRTLAPIQKYTDQAISINTSYDPSKGEIKMSQLLGDLILGYKLGHKTFYYSNTRDGSGDAVEDDSCAGGACKI